jgi:hypothetical protein
VLAFTADAHCKNTHTSPPRSASRQTLELCAKLASSASETRTVAQHWPAQAGHDALTWVRTCACRGNCPPIPCRTPKHERLQRVGSIRASSRCPTYMQPHPNLFVVHLPGEDRAQLAKGPHLGHQGRDIIRAVSDSVPTRCAVG